VQPPVSRAVEFETHPGRWTLGGYAEAYGIVETDADSPRQRPEGIFDAILSGDLYGVRPHLDVQMLVGGPPEHATGFGIFNFQDVFQNISPSIEFEEGYFDFTLANIDIRAGLQKFAWGKLDRFHPTDIVNPRQFSDPFLTDETDAKIGIPSISASGYPPDPQSQWLSSPSVTLLWVPVPIPFRFPLQDERWFPPAATVPPIVEIPAGVLGPLLPSATIRTTFATANTAAHQRLEDGAFGARLAGLSAGVDWSLYFYNGRETAPAFDLGTSVRLAMDREPGTIVLDGTAVLQPRFGQIWLTGGDAAFQFAGFTARAEAAYGSNRLVPRSTADLVSTENILRAVGPDITSILQRLLMGETVPVNLGDLFERRDVVEWGVGVDYAYKGWTPVLQINQAVVLHNDVTLLVPNVDTRLLAALRKTFLSDRLASELIGVQGFERSYTTAIARLTYTLTDYLRIRAGYLLIAGSRNTVLGQYKNNDEVFLQIRLSH